MKKVFYLSTLIVLLFTFLSFAQPKDAYLYEFLGKSKGQITNVWGNPEKVDIDKSGYVVWRYSNDHGAVRTFYFYDGSVKMTGSVIFIKDYDYAVSVWMNLTENLETQGFWVDTTAKSVTTVTNGKVYVDCRISKNRANYSISLLAYR